MMTTLLDYCLLAAVCSGAVGASSATNGSGVLGGDRGTGDEETGGEAARDAGNSAAAESSFFSAFSRGEAIGVSFFSTSADGTSVAVAASPKVEKKQLLI